MDRNTNSSPLVHPPVVYRQPARCSAITQSILKLQSACIAAILFLAALTPANLSATENDLQIALTLANILRSARAEIASQQAHINDPKVGNKGLTGDVIVDNVLSRLAKDHEFDLNSLEKDSLSSRLVNQQLQAMREIADENQALFNRKDVGFKGFVPAVFAQLVNERFGENVGDLATIKVTAPLHLVRNRKARPDSWERKVIEEKFSSSDWKTGSLYSELSKDKKPAAFRVMVPEYYGDACLSCHGAPKGELDITGYPKEGGVLGELGGAISISLFR